VGVWVEVMKFLSVITESSMDEIIRQRSIKNFTHAK
jgi:hypothetical protein